MLTRKTPMKRGAFKRKPVAMKRTKLKRMSKKKASEMRKYWPIRKAFLVRVPYCEICFSRETKIPLERVRAEISEQGKIAWAHARLATEIHHKFSRNGSLLCDIRGFIASCLDCRDYPKDHPEEARKLGLLGKASEIGVPIDLHKKDK